MAKATKRWAVRSSYGYVYFLLVGLKPRKPKGGWGAMRRPCSMVPVAAYERFFDKKYHLPIDGGPVEIEFKEP